MFFPDFFEVHHQLQASFLARVESEHNLNSNHKLQLELYSYTCIIVQSTIKSLPLQRNLARSTRVLSEADRSCSLTPRSLLTFFISRASTIKPFLSFDANTGRILTRLRGYVRARTKALRTRSWEPSPERSAHFFGPREFRSRSGNLAKKSCFSDARSEIERNFCGRDHFSFSLNRSIVSFHFYEGLTLSTIIRVTYKGRIRVTLGLRKALESI